MNSDDNALSKIRQGLALLYEASDIVELRAFHQTHLDYPTTISGFFDDLDKLALAIQDVNSHTQKNGKKTRITVYTTLNPVKKTWQTVNNKVYWGSKQLRAEITGLGIPLSASPRMKSGTNFNTQATHYKMRTTSDGESDILARRWILLDIDAGQPADTNSSGAEKENAFNMATTIIRDLQERGFPPMALCDSGNGWHVLLRVNLPNTAEVTDIVRRFLKALAMKFDGKHGSAHLDVKVGNAGRITKAYGSVVYKGGDTPERPCRRSKVIETASKPATLEQVSAVADEFAPPSKLQSFTEDIDQPELKTQIEKVLAYLDHNDIEYKEAIVADSMVKIPVTCPNEREHTTDGIESSTIVTVSKSGAFGFNCQHAHCAGLCGWRNFRRRLDKKFSMLHADEPPFQWSPQAYLNRDTQNDEEPKPEVEPFVQPSIIVPARKKTLHEKAVALLDELLPVAGSRCLLQTVFKEAAAKGISKRSIQRAYKRMSLLPVNDDVGAWLVRQEPNEEIQGMLEGGELR